MTNRFSRSSGESVITPPRASPNAEPMPSTLKAARLEVFTTTCPDTTSIVAAMAGFLASNNGLITEAQHHGDPYTRACGYKDAKAYHQAHARGVKPIGATAYYVRRDLEEGSIIEQEVERVHHTRPSEDSAVLGSELETLHRNRAIKWHAGRREFRNGNNALVLT